MTSLSDYETFVSDNVLQTSTDGSTIDYQPPSLAIAFEPDTSGMKGTGLPNDMVPERGSIQGTGTYDGISHGAPSRRRPRWWPWPPPAATRRTSPCRPRAAKRLTRLQAVTSLPAGPRVNVFKG